MSIKVKENSLAFHMLLSLFSAGDILEAVTAHPSKWERWQRYGAPETCRTTFYRLMRSGFIEVIEKDKHKYINLTPKGRVQVLIAKARIPKPENWDGKWRVVFFDIPEDNKIERHQLRRLLLKNEYKKMQGSVYVSPWPLSREAIAYLRETGLIAHIRIGKLEELDDDSDLKKEFNLK